MLVFPGGTEIGLEIHRALCSCKQVRLFSAGAAVSNHAPFVYERHFVIPSVTEPGWLEALNRLVREHAIDYVMPAHDDVVLALAEHRDRIETGVISSPPDTCRITRFKSLTYQVLKGVVPTPDVYARVEDVPRYPVFAKPDRGQGSQDAYVVHDQEHLAWLLRSDRGYIVTEYLPGAEFTVDCFSDREQGLLFCAGRRRVRTRAGIAMATELDTNPRFAEYAQRISERLTFHGAWFFQVKYDVAGQLKLLEIGARVAGTMALNRALGVNFPLLSLYEQERVPIAIRPQPISVSLDRALVNRYRTDLTYRTVYVDFDDTLVLRGCVNTQLVAFLYQCLNRGIKIVLLTRHEGDLPRALEKHRLRGLFDEIIHVAKGQCKADCITGTDAIFIDDSFRERCAVQEKLGLPVFDTWMIEALIDERV